MLIDVTNFLKGDVKLLDFTQELTIPQKTYGSVTINTFEVSVKGYFTLREQFILEAELTADLDMSCDLCLKQLKYPLSFHISEEFADENSDAAQKDEVWTFTGKTIDLTPPIHGAVLLNLPMRVLCKEDCKGLCHLCGNDLNLSECSCKESYVDPRWQDLRSFFDEKEV